jgi:hypothetical protein
LALVGALGIAGCASQGSATPRRPVPEGRLLLASPQLSGWAYSLPDVSSCVVGDGLAVLKNGSRMPMRVTGLQTEVGGAATPSSVHVTYQVLAVRRGSTPGELSGSGPLTRLWPARALPSASGAILLPASTSGLWYVVVARLRVEADLRHSWSVRGMTVTYVTGSRTRTAFFTQHVTVRMSGSCTLPSGGATSANATASAL